MPQLTLSGPYPLTQTVLRDNLQRRTPGVFVVGDFDGGVITRIGRLGRSDHDLAADLHRLVGRWAGFLFQSAASATEAYQLECLLFHEVRRLDLPHPVRPRGTDLVCATCGIWGADAAAADDRAAYYRQKAADLRATAETMAAGIRGPLTELADSYERLAAVNDWLTSSKAS